jgi:hypothetical protein
MNQTDNFTRMLYPVLLGFCINFLRRLYAYLRDMETAELGPTIQASIFIFWALCCVLANKRFHLHTPLLIFVLPLVFATLVNLQLRDLLPDLLADRSLSHQQDNFELLLILCTCLNYTSYLTTMVLYPLVFLSWSYFQTEANLETYIDPETMKPLGEEQKTWELE